MVENQEEQRSSLLPGCWEGCKNKQRLIRLTGVLLLLLAVLMSLALG